MRNFSDTGDNTYGEYEDQVKYICDKLPSVGVTTVYPTLAGSNYEQIKRSVRKIRKVRPECKGAKLDKLQFEGCYMSLERYVTKEAVNPTKEHTDYLVDNDYSDVSMLHVSPDLPGSMEWCDYMVSKGVMPTVGNTGASTEDVIKAADHDLCQADHMYNGYEAMHHRKNGAAVGVLLDDRIKAQLTCDGFHVSSAWVKLIIKTKGLQNVYGVTDMSYCSGIEDGKHVFPNGKVVIARDGFIFDEEGYIESGNMAMNEVLKAARDKLGLSMEEIGSLYAENVARCIGITDRGKIEVGRCADFVLMDKDYNVIQTIIDGKTYYKNKELD